MKTAPGRLNPGKMGGIEMSRKQVRISEQEQELINLIRALKIEPSKVKLLLLDMFKEGNNEIG